jgi:hypothetical protein
MRWAALHQGDPSRWLVAAGVVAMLVALVVVVACRPATSPEGDAGVSQPTKSTVRTDAAPVATGLAVAGPVALPGPAAATLGGRGLQAAQRCASHRWRGVPGERYGRNILEEPSSHGQGHRASMVVTGS